LNRIDLLHSEILDLDNLNHNALSLTSPCFGVRRNVPLLAKGEGRRAATGWGYSHDLCIWLDARHAGSCQCLLKPTFFAFWNWFSM